MEPIKTSFGDTVTVNASNIVVENPIERTKNVLYSTQDRHEALLLLILKEVTLLNRRGD